jgi:hypothetical protein
MQYLSILGRSAYKSLQLVDLVVDYIVDFGVESGWQALLAGNLVDGCGKQISI